MIRIEQSDIQADVFRSAVRKRSDRLMDYFLSGFFLLGIVLATFYGTWLIAFGIGGISLLAYYSVKMALPESRLYQYVLSAVLGVFMAQYIYQMHGLFEMHFFAFIGSAVLITYQKWKLQIPILLVVLFHHAVFSYMQNSGVPGVYFTQLNYFDLQTFVIHVLLTGVIFFICGLWSYQLKKYNEIQIHHTIKLTELQKEAELSVERKKKEEALEERNTILESIGDAFFATDKNWTVTYWNKAAEKILKKPKKEILGRNLWDVYPDAVDTPFYDNFYRALRENIPQYFEASYHQRADYYETSIYPSGNGLSVYIKDVSARKAADIQMKQLNHELRSQAKDLAFSNAELEQFAYVASHDLQEPLRMITSFMTLLEKRYSDIIDEKGKQYIHFAVDGGKRMRQIILDLLEYSRVDRTEDKQEEVDLNALIYEITGLYRRKIQEQHAVINVGRLPTILTYNAPMRQVLHNLVGNSLKYQKPGVVPVVSVTCEETDQYWQFAVKDNGIGIDPKYFEKIFIIFQRLDTGGQYQGTGLGLAVTKKIVGNLGGKIWVESEPGEGSTFTFTILKTRPVQTTLTGEFVDTKQLMQEAIS